MASPGESAGASAEMIHEDIDILEQEREIREQTEVVPLVAAPVQLDALREQYADNAGFLPKVQNLAKSFRALRRTRPDGNCFYRAYMFGMMEQLPNSPERQGFLQRRAKEAMDFCTAAGYERIAIEDFSEVFTESLEKLSSSSTSTPTDNDHANTPPTPEQILEENDGYLICWARILTSAFLKRHKEDYEPFLTSHPDMQTFCSREVDPMNVDADNLQITALSTFFGVPVKVVYLDQSSGDTCTEHAFQGGAECPLQQIVLLYRPGHYDLLYA
eukprot:TRINITY_DN101279_c0_g1_i1.p1 TRINITY_DN101279_c0_g1~~TRINITY_DN101279_c0_g1_i1.p1  ORF type:complete len:273 (-),score=53.00 TRINITY_DN101279_c0_g1_i1:145-963(-)